MPANIDQDFVFFLPLVSFQNMASLQGGKSYHGTYLYAASHRTADDTYSADLARLKYDMAVPSPSTAVKLEDAMVNGGSNERPAYLDSSVNGGGQGQPPARYDKRRRRCDACPFSTTSKLRLMQHFRKHYDERGFKCAVCAKGFYKSGHLSDHMRIHTGEKPFGCNICLRQFTQKSAMVRHRLQVHKQKKDSRDGTYFA